MKFVLLIVGSDAAYAELTEDETKQMYAAQDEFGAMLAGKGAVVSGAELLTDTRIVTPSGAERIVTAGPFSETTEGIGGWYVVQADDIDAAAEYAKAIPMLATDHVEVRPIRE